jgi:hypothetical protein
MALLAALLCAPQAALAVPGGCVSTASKDLVCVLQISNDANSTTNVYGTHLDQLQAIVITFDDGSERTYYKPGVGTNPAGSTVSWGTAASISDAMLAGAGLPKGYADHVVAKDMSSGSLISIVDPANGGKTVVSYKFYDELPISTTRNAPVSISPAQVGSWVPPTVTAVQTDVDTLTLTSPAGLESATRLNMTCSQLGVASTSVCSGALATLPSFNNPPLATTAPSVVVSWSDTKIVVRHPGFPGTLMSSFTLRNGTSITTYPVSPAVLFAPRIDAVARTTADRQYVITGASFGRLTKLRVKLEDGTVRTVIRAGGSDAGITIAGWTEGQIVVTDTALKGHSIENVKFFYGGSTDPVAETNQHLYFIGSIDTALSDAVNSLTLQGSGLQAIVHLVISFDDGLDYVIDLTENYGTYSELTITDDVLGGRTVTGVTATAFDGQVMTLLGQAITIQEEPVQPPAADDFLVSLQYSPQIGGNTFQFYKTTPDGTHTILTTDNTWSSNYANEFAVWSPDRSVIVAGQYHNGNSIDERVIAIDPATGAVTVIKANAGYLASNIAFLDNDTIVFAMTSGPQWYNTNLFRIDTDGTDLVQLTHDTAGNFRPQVTSPGDGNTIIYTAVDNNTGVGRIVRMDANGGNVTQLLGGLSYTYSPIATSDGKTLIYRTSVPLGNTSTVTINKLDLVTLQTTQLTSPTNDALGSYSMGAFNIVLSPDEDRVGFACLSYWMPPEGATYDWDTGGYVDEFGNPLQRGEDHAAMCSVALDGSGVVELGRIGGVSGDRSFYGADGRLYTQAYASEGVGVYSFADDQAGQTARLEFPTTWNQVIGGTWRGRTS